MTEAGEIRQIVLVRRPVGAPVPEDFALVRAPMPVPVPGPGEILVKMRVGSCDPAIRGFLDDRPSYLPPVALGAPINGMSIGEVVASNNPDWQVGDLLRAFVTWSDHYVIGADAMGLTGRGRTRRAAAALHVGAWPCGADGVGRAVRDRQGRCG